MSPQRDEHVRTRPCAAVSPYETVMIRNKAIVTIGQGALAVRRRGAQVPFRNLSV